MKDPRAFFPFLFASSWIGNLLLTVLAFFLAFTHEGPLTPFVFATVAICILSGNALPISVYWIYVRWRESELKAENAEANYRVRDALRRSEEVMARLDEAEGALSKTILLARQVPDRIRESSKDLESLNERLNTLEITSFTESLEGQTQTISDLEKELSSFGKRMASMEEHLADVPRTLDTLIKEAAPAPSRDVQDEDAVGLGERLDIVFESLETVQDSLDGLLSRLSEIQNRLTGGTPVPGISGETTGTAVKETPESEEEISRKKVTKSVEREKSVEDEPQVSKPSVSGVKLTVHAMVGISNKVYIRGDEPWLSWDAGQPMNLIGIGEFFWTDEDIEEPIEVAVLLNDELEAEGSPVKLIPGKPVRLNVKFPKS